MSPLTIGVVSSAVVAIAFFLDILFSKSRHRVHDKFLLWWYWFSNLKVRQAIDRSIVLTLRVLDSICGRKTFSIEAILRATLAVALLAELKFFWLIRGASNSFYQKLFGISILILPVLPPAVVVLMITRALLRRASRSPKFSRIMLLGIANLLVVLVGVELMAFFYGVCAQAWIDAAYNHHISVENTAAMLSSSYAFFFAFSHIYGNIALLPAILFAGLFAIWMAIFLAAAVCRLVEEFLRLQVEESVPKPFTAIATAFCMAIALIYPTVILLTHFDVKQQFQLAEHALNRSAFQLGERWVSAKPHASLAGDKEYVLYDLRCQVALIATEFIGPSQQQVRNVHAIWAKIKTEWAASSENHPTPTVTPGH